MITGRTCGLRGTVSGPLLQVRDLSVDYLLEKGAFRAVKNVSFEIGRSEFFGLAGIERTLVRLQLRDPWVVAEESRLQPRQPVAHRQRTEVHRRQRDHVLFAIVVEHVGPIGGERELEQ